jgi:signal transduction histidine kinase
MAVATAQPRHVGALGLRRRVDEAVLAERVALLVRRNEALDDFASLVAHELKGSLLPAASADPDGIGRAIDLIDDLLDAARSEGAEGWAKPHRGLDDALRDLRERPSSIQSELPVMSRAGASWWLTVEDDGAGFGGGSLGRPGGHGIGLALCRRIVERRGGTLELGESSMGGARATITLPGPSR